MQRKNISLLEFTTIYDWNIDSPCRRDRRSCILWTIITALSTIPHLAISTSVYSLYTHLYPRNAFLPLPSAPSSLHHIRRFHIAFSSRSFIFSDARRSRATPRRQRRYSIRQRLAPPNYLVAEPRKSSNRDREKELHADGPRGSRLSRTRMDTDVRLRRSSLSRLVATRFSVDAFLHRVHILSAILSPDPSPAIPRLRLEAYDHFTVVPCLAAIGRSPTHWRRISYLLSGSAQDRFVPQSTAPLDE